MKVRELEREQPISMRHILDLKSDREPIDRRRSIPASGLHSYPIVISLDVVRLAGRDRLPRLPRGGDAAQHRLRSTARAARSATCTASTRSGAASRSPPAASA